MNLKMKLLYFTSLLCLMFSCESSTDSNEKVLHNPFLVDLNVPIDYAKITAKDVEDYANHTLASVTSDLAVIKAQQSETFDNIFVSTDEINNKLNKASQICHMLFWVSPDSLTRAKGLWGFQLLNTVATDIYSDKGLFTKMVIFKSSDAYKELKGNKKILVDDLILGFELSGVNLNNEEPQ